METRFRRDKTVELKLQRVEVDIIPRQCDVHGVGSLEMLFFFVRFFPRCKKQTSKLQTNCRSLDNFWLQESHVFAPPTPPPHPKFGSAVGVCSQSFAGSGQSGSPKRSWVFSTNKSHGSQV